MIQKQEACPGTAPGQAARQERAAQLLLPAEMALPAHPGAAAMAEGAAEAPLLLTQLAEQVAQVAVVAVVAVAVAAEPTQEPVEQVQ